MPAQPHRWRRLGGGRFLGDRIASPLLPVTGLAAAVGPRLAEPAAGQPGPRSLVNSPAHPGLIPAALQEQRIFLRDGVGMD